MRLYVLLERGDYENSDNVEGVYTSRDTIEGLWHGWSKRKQNDHRIEEWESDGGARLSWELGLDLVRASDLS